MAFRNCSAIARYKAAARKIRRDRKAGKPVPLPAHLSSGKPAALQAVTGEWFVWSPPSASRHAKQLAGPFDTREEAAQWISAQP